MMCRRSERGQCRVSPHSKADTPLVVVKGLPGLPTAERKDTCFYTSGDLQSCKKYFSMRNIGENILDETDSKSQNVSGPNSHSL